MLLRSATYHNIGPFKDYTLNVEDKRGLVALVAPNGRGKSSAMEIGFLGGCYRKTETQGTLKERATDRDAWVKTEITYGKPYTIQQFVDPQAKTAGESLVHDAGGVDQLPDTKVSSYDAWAARELPDDDVFLAGPFCAQGDDGFVSMGSAERIAVILRVRGVAKLEKMAKVFAKRASKASDLFQSLVTRIADARAGVPLERDAVAALEAAQRSAAEADESVNLAKEALAVRQRQAADHAVNKASREAAQKHLATLTEQRDAARARVTATEQALVAAQSILADATAIRAAVAQLPGEELVLADLRGAYAAADAGIRTELDPWRDGAQRRAAAAQRRTAAQLRLADEKAIQAALAERDALKALAEVERASVADADAALAALGARDKVGDTERIAGLRSGLEQVADCEISDASVTAERALAADDAAVTSTTEFPKLLLSAKAALQAARDRQAVAERKLADAEKLAARAPDLATARADLAAAEKEVADLLVDHVVAVISALARSLSRLQVAAAGKAKTSELEPLRARAARLSALEASEGRIAELEPQGFAAQIQVERLNVQISEIEEVEIVDLGEPPDVGAAEAAVAAAEVAARDCAAGVARAEQTLARAREVDARVSKFEAERDAAAAELADWTRLELDFGRKGIQSAEVDSSGPELTELCNDLLHRCHGPQFTVLVQTQRLDSDAKKLIEECNVTVFDSVKGTKKELRQHSGGEKVLLGVAMRLALSMMACRKAGFSDFTFVCDEGGAALDPANNRAFVAMLRHALAITGARHVLLVSHSEEVQKMCDHIIEIPQAA